MTTLTAEGHGLEASVLPLAALDDARAAIHDIDVNEEALAARATGLLSDLLLDRSTGGNIIWATDHYEHLGEEYAPNREITIESVTGEHHLLIQPRVEKSKAQQWDRTKGRAEVFTPSWLCNEQNNRVDEAWFGRADVFNTVVGRSWIHRAEPIGFEARGRRTWQKYVDERRLEAACGEGPYLVSRYDAATGARISLDRRIGLLDRKLRVVTENTRSDDEWRAWARRAVESVYGFEYQGDSLLLARENVLATYEDFARAALGSAPSAAELRGIATVISWNIWQMDLLTGRPPLQANLADENQLDLFGEQDAHVVRSCLIRDWRAKRTQTYAQLTNESDAAS
ncbi:hypothetical protein [Isoptericola sp. NPDC057191]|uniref:hypothetical protein n=1 Tax=Isoptericola sp. NPDC057191 TaxID=3346041 RepID=UPI0036428F39